MSEIPDSLTDSGYQTCYFTLLDIKITKNYQRFTTVCVPSERGDVALLAVKLCFKLWANQTKKAEKKTNGKIS